MMTGRARPSVKAPLDHLFNRSSAHASLGDDDAVDHVDDAVAGAHVGRDDERLRCERRASVRRAGWLARLWTHLTARFELTLLYEVSFSAGRTAPAHARPLPRKRP